MIRLDAVLQNMELLSSNERADRAGLAMIPLVKTVAGHGPAAPQDPALAALAVGGPVPVGTALPALAFPPAGVWDRAAVISLTNAELNDLDWFYNVRFAGASIAHRRVAFLAFLGSR